MRSVFKSVDRDRNGNPGQRVAGGTREAGKKGAGSGRNYATLSNIS